MKSSDYKYQEDGHHVLFVSIFFQAHGRWIKEVKSPNLHLASLETHRADGLIPVQASRL